MPENNVVQFERLLNRCEAARYLTDVLGSPSSKRQLDKFACLGGGPAYRVSGKRVVYEPKELRRWAWARLSDPITCASERASIAR